MCPPNLSITFRAGLVGRTAPRFQPIGIDTIPYICHATHAMKKTMVYLPEDLHEGLRQLAFEHRTSMAELIRRAVQAAYGETIEDIRDAEAELAGYLKDPSTAVSLEDFLAERKLRVPRRTRVSRPARA